MWGSFNICSDRGLPKSDICGTALISHVGVGISHQIAPRTGPWVGCARTQEVGERLSDDSFWMLSYLLPGVMLPVDS